MTVHNSDIAKIFITLADLLEIEGANPFRIRAYRRAAEVIEDLPKNAADMLRAGADFEELPGIGEDLAGKMREIIETGRLKALEAVEARTPSTLTTLTAVPGLGPKRVHALHEKLGIATLDGLAHAAAAHKIRKLSGFSEKFETKIEEQLTKLRSAERRMRISTATELAASLLTHMKTASGIGKVIIAGSYRRCKETIGDLDVLAAGTRPKAVIDHFIGYEEVANTSVKGTTRATVMLQSGVQVDLRVVPKESFGSALHYFTGSKSHNIAIRKLGQARGLKINEYGVFRGANRIGGRSERDVFSAVGLPYIEPELREDRGEIEAAQAGHLPKLITLADVRGDLHVHTTASDGKNDLREMAETAARRGYRYLAITDHTKHVTIAHGLDERRLSKQLDQIDRLNDEFDGICLLKSAEVDILADGSLDLSDRILKRLDFVVGAVHYKFDLDEKRQTERILKAMDNRYFTILAHPSGRLLGERSAHHVDLDRVVAGAKERGCFLELNAHPARLDIDDVHCKMAKDMGVLVSIATDAHSTMGLDMMRYGIGQARRGWLEPKDVLNTRALAALKRLFRR
jgi:DNA polymerase (family 10)